MSATPTTRSLDHLRKRGMDAQVVEKWIPAVKRRQDLFGVIDIVAISDTECVGVQTTSATNLAARRTKAEEEPRLQRWLRAGCRFELHAWGLKGARGKRKTYQITRQVAQLTVHGIVWRDEDAEQSEGLRIL